MRHQRKLPRPHATFSAFYDILDIIVNTDSLSSHDTADYMNEWYELYKTQKETDVVEWAKIQFNIGEVTKDSHDFWLDKRGLAIYELRGKLSVAGIFPTF